MTVDSNTPTLHSDELIAFLAAPKTNDNYFDLISSVTFASFLSLLGASDQVAATSQRFRGGI